MSDANGFANAASHIIADIDRILAQLSRWAQPQIDAYLHAAMMVAGGIVADCPRRFTTAPTTKTT
jgi:hypothetical protein